MQHIVPMKLNSHCNPTPLSCRCNTTRPQNCMYVLVVLHHAQLQPPQTANHSAHQATACRHCVAIHNIYRTFNIGPDTRFQADSTSSMNNSRSRGISHHKMRRQQTACQLEHVPAWQGQASQCWQCPGPRRGGKLAVCSAGLEQRKVNWHLHTGVGSSLHVHAPCRQHADSRSSTAGHE